MYGEIHSASETDNGRDFHPQINSDSLANIESADEYVPLASIAHKDPAFLREQELGMQPNAEDNKNLYATAVETVVGNLKKSRGLKNSELKRDVYYAIKGWPRTYRMFDLKSRQEYDQRLRQSRLLTWRGIKKEVLSYSDNQTEVKDLILKIQKVLEET